VGSNTDAARSEVLAARDGLAAEIDRLEAAGRAAVDIPAKIRRAPLKTAGVAAGAAFLVAGGPKRLFRRVRRAVRGPDAELPKSMLPKEVDRALRALGPDGDKVRGTLEREFAKYLEEHAPERRERDLGAVTALLLGNLAKPLSQRAGRRLVEELFSPEGSSFAEAIDRIRARREVERVAPDVSSEGPPTG
jgi:hypothetical protein